MSRSAPRWDVLVLGGGTAGIVAAKTAARLGARTVLVERNRTGGDCLWTGCVPSKTLLSAARSHAAGGSDPGVDAFGAAMARVRAAVARIAPVDSVESIESVGVTVVPGHGRFVGPRELEVDGRLLGFDQAILATGAAPALPPIDGLDEVDPLTSETFWSLTEAPRSLLVVGGGSIGCELGQAAARLGSAVTIVEAGPRLLPGHDELAATVLREQLTHDGVEVVTGYGVEAVGRRGALTWIETSDARRFSAERLLVATGRRPRTADIGLEALAVRCDEAGHVVVDRRLRTSNARIWAAGDLTAMSDFTHTAGTHASLAASNAVLGLRRRVRTDAVPRVTYTDPEIASVGPLAEQAVGLRALHQPHADVDRAVAEDRTEGFARLLVDGRGRIKGGTVVGPRAGETIGEVTVAVTQRMTTRDLAGVVHAYPTWNDGPWNAAIADVREQLASPRARRVIAVVRWLRGRWLGGRWLGGRWSGRRWERARVVGPASRGAGRG